MFTPTSYLIPQSADTSNSQAPKLNDLVQELLEAHGYAVQSAKNLLTSPPLHDPRFNVLFKDRATTLAHAKFYTTGSGFGVAYCTFMSLSNVCKSILELCKSKLLPYARVLDKPDTAGESFLNIARNEFRAQLAHIKTACCTGNTDASNLMWSVQTLMPALSKLSGQIDTIALGKQEAISQVPRIEALPHLAQLSQIKNFNVHVNRVLTLAQSILNMMNEWQDQLELLMEESEEALPNGFYEDQVLVAIDYWQKLQENLIDNLQNRHDNKSKSSSVSIPSANPYPFRAQPWRPKLTASESWA